MKQSMGRPKTTDGTIIDRAREAGTFSLFLRALKETGLDRRLNGEEGDYTVFVPADEAFRDMSGDTFKDLFGDRQFLSRIISYHIVPGRLTSDGWKTHPRVNTLQGEEISIDASGKAPTVEDAEIVTADILCSNGVIHVIDTLLIPKPKPAAV